MRNRKLVVLATLSALLGFNVHAQVPQDLWDVVLCPNCTNVTEFESVAHDLAGEQFNGERHVLVTNPHTSTSRIVTIINTPPGELPMGQPADGALPAPTGMLLPLTSDRSDFIRFARTPEEGAQARISSLIIMSRAPTTGEDAEIGAIIELSREDLIIVLPHTPNYYGSFTGRNSEAIALLLNGKMIEHHPGWASAMLSRRTRKALGERLKMIFGKGPQICAIFNNGDSACFEPDPGMPSVENYIEGSAKDVDGNAVPGSGGGGGGLSVSQAYRPLGGWAAAGSSGGSGEAWLICSYQGGKLIGCYVQVL